MKQADASLLSDHRAQEMQQRTHGNRAEVGAIRMRLRPRDEFGDGELKARYESLTPREQEVFALVAAGLLNKVIANRLGAAESTVKIHRGRVMEKMVAGSAADLVRMAERLAVSLPDSATG